MSRGKRKVFCLIGVTVTDISFVYSSFGMYFITRVIPNDTLFLDLTIAGHSREETAPSPLTFHAVSVPFSTDVAI